MARRNTFHRWTEEEKELLRELWPVLHEQEVFARLEGKFTLKAIRYKAQRLGVKKTQERWDRNKFAYQKLAEAEQKICELLTIQRCLQEKVRRLEAQIKATSLRAWAK